MKMKYIMFNDNYPVIFSPGINHSDIKINGLKPTSAGFVDIWAGGTSSDTCTLVNTNGDSFTLKMKPAEKDQDIIQRLLNDY